MSTATKNATTEIKAPPPKPKKSLQQAVQVSEKLSSTFFTQISQANKIIDTTGKTPTAIERTMETQKLLQPKKAHGMLSADAEQLEKRSIDHSMQFGEGPDQVFKAFDENKTRLATWGDDVLIKVATINATLSKALGTQQAIIADYFESLLKLFSDSEQKMGEITFLETFAGRTALLTKNFNTAPEKFQKNLEIAAPAAAAANVAPSEAMTVMALGSSQMPDTTAGTAYASITSNADAAGRALGLDFSDGQGGVGKMTSLLDALKSKYGEVLDSAEKDQLSQVFGSEKAANLLELLFNQSEKFKTVLTQIEQVTGLEPAISMAQDMVDPWSKIEHSIKAVWLSLGVYLAPQLAIVADGVAALANIVKTVLDRFPLLGKSIVFTALAITGLSIAMVVLKAIIVTLIGIQALWAATLKLVNSQTLINYYTTLKTNAVRAMGIVITTASAAAQLVCSAAAWLLNTALSANPIMLVVRGVMLCVAIIGPLIYYWDALVAALRETEAFQTVVEWFEKISTWFNSMGGWSGLASAAWDSIVGVFNTSLNALIDLLNSIPGVNIETRFGEVPSPPGQEQMAAANRAHATIAAATPSLLTSADANKVPPGGLMNSFQNTTQQNRGTHVEKVEIHTGKPMTSHDLQGLLEMAG